MADKKNIIVGAANVFIGTAAAVKPPAVANTSYSTTLRAATGWRDVGYTQDGVELTYSPDYADVEVDQLLDSARIFRTSQRVMIATTFAEATLLNLLLVWGQASNTHAVNVNAATPPAPAPDATTGVTATLEIVPGQLGESPLENQFASVGNGSEGTGGYNERTYHVTRVLSVEDSSQSQRRSEATVFPVSFRLLPDDLAPKSRYGTIVDRVRPAGGFTN